MTFLNIIDETEDEFQRIAQTLFDHYAIKNEKGFFRLVDVEFYWNSPTHLDKSTYRPIHVDLKAGDWFFHYSGVDIALRNNNKEAYGGILIRSVYDFAQMKEIKGPMVCAMKLFSGTSAFSPATNTYLFPHNFPESLVLASSRIGLGKNAEENGFDKRSYRFYIENKESEI